MLCTRTVCSRTKYGVRRGRRFCWTIAEPVTPPTNVDWGASARLPGHGVTPKGMEVTYLFLPGLRGVVVAGPSYVAFRKSLDSVKSVQVP